MSWRATATGERQTTTLNSVTIGLWSSGLILDDIGAKGLTVRKNAIPLEVALTLNVSAPDRTLDVLVAVGDEEFGAVNLRDMIGEVLPDLSGDQEGRASLRRTSSALRALADMIDKGCEEAAFPNARRKG